LGVHVIDLVRYLAGSPKPVSVFGAVFGNIGNREHIKIPKDYVSADYKKGEASSVEDMAAAMIRFENGMVMNLETSFSLNTEKDFGSIELFGTKSGAKIDPELRMFSEKNGYLTNIIPAHKTALSFDGLFEKEIRHFVDCVKGEAECISTAKDGIEVMKIIDAVYESAETKREVLIKGGKS
jgi:predicted dehydrogenase